jgi:methanogenic corrinoid protein MtbC1
MSQDAMLKALHDSMLALNQDSVLGLVKEAAARQVDPHAITGALGAAMRAVGERYARGECFIPELVFCGQIFSQALEILAPEMKGQENASTTGKKVVIGTVKGDLHDLGVKLVSVVLTMGGFEVVNLGKDVPTDLFVGKVKEIRPQILGLSALLTTTLNRQQEVIRTLEAHDLRGTVKVMIGGAPVMQEWADTIGADAVGFDAIDALKKARKLMGLAE